MSLTRRSFLAASASAAVAPAARAAATGFRLVTQADTVYVILPGSRSWSVSPARAAGSDVIEDLRLILPSGDTCTVRLRFREARGHVLVGADVVGWPLSRVLPDQNLAKFLSGDAMLSARLPHRAAPALLQAMGAALGPPGPFVANVRLCLRRSAGPHGLELLLRAAGQPIEALGRPARLLLLYPAPPEPPPQWRATVMDSGFPRTLQLGQRAGTSVTLRIPDTALLHLRDADQREHVTGRVALHMGRARGQFGPVLATAAMFAGEHADRTVTLTPFDGHWPLVTPFGSFGASGAPQPGRVTIRHGQAKIDISVRLHEAAVTVAGAAFSRLDFRGEAARLTLGAPVSGPGLWIPLDHAGSGPSGAHDLPLDEAQLRVARPDDLLSLRFTFNRVALRLGHGSPLLVAGPGRPGRPDEPLLVVEFPPQHVAEQAFPRQKLPETVTATGPQHPADRKKAREDAEQVREATRNAVAKDIDGNKPETLIAALNALGIADLGLEKTVVVSIETAGGDVATLWAVASRRSPVLDEFAKAWSAFREQRPAGRPVAFALTNWPTELKWLAAPVKPVPGAAAAEFLRRRLELAEAAPDVIAWPAQARFSGASRIAFALTPTQLGPHGMPFSLGPLIDWSKMELRVVRQAERIDRKTADNTVVAETSIEAILNAHGLKASSGSAKEAVRQRREQLAAQLEFPTVFQTALELPARLLLSPDQHAKFVPTRRHASAGRRAALWQARLMESDPERRSLRAVWSPDYVGGVFKPDPDRAQWPALSDRAPAVPFRTSLGPADRHELVGLTSLQGLPVLARIGPDGTLDGSQWSSGETYALDLDHAAKTKLVRDAIYLPATLPARRVALSSLGGTLDLDAHFVPPASPRFRGQDLFDAFSVERWTARIALGRETLMEIVRKGFLFPTGHRASLVRTTQREIGSRTVMLLGGPRQVGPTAPLTQRVAIETPTTPKSYLGSERSDHGRRCFARSASVVGGRTPDLIDPTDEVSPATGGPMHADDRLIDTPLGNVRPPTGRGPLVGTVFWPRTVKGRTGNVQFRLSLDGRPEPVTMPLLFLDNRAAHNAATVQAVIERYWNAPSLPASMIPDQNWFDVVPHRGAVRTYAVEEAEGDCSFVTDWQQVGAEGVRGSNEPYVVTPAMEAVDQPPFYPVLRQAALRPQQVTRLTGRPAEQLRVAFNRSYLARGFEDTNLGDQFLQVIGTGPTLDMGRNGDRAGGVGRPGMPIQAFSRKKGPWSQVRDGGIEFAGSGAASLKFFSDDAMLLGVVSLNDLVGLLGDAAAPVLTETLDYGLRGAGQLSSEAAKFIAAALQPIQTLLDTKLPRHDPQSTFPDPSLAFDGLRKAVDALETAAKQLADDATIPAGTDKQTAAGTDQRIAAETGKHMATAWSAGQHLMAELRQLERAPFGPIADQVHDGLRSFARQLTETVDPGGVWYAARRAVAILIAGIFGAGAWAEAVLSGRDLPGLSAAASAAVEHALQTAAADPETWLAPAPIAEAARRVRTDPDVASALAGATDAITACALEGPLADDARALAGALAVDKVVDFAAVGAALKRLDVERERWQALHDLPATVCKDALTQVAAMLGLLTPDPRVVTALLADMQAGVGALAALPDQLRSLPDLSVPDLIKLLAWSADQQGRMARAVAEARSLATDLAAAAKTALPTGNPCGQLSAGFAPGLRAVLRLQARLVAAACSVVGAFRAPPASVPVATLAPALGAAAGAAVKLALAATIAAPGADQDRARAVLVRAGFHENALRAATTVAHDIRTRADQLRVTALTDLTARALEIAIDLQSKVEAALEPPLAAVMQMIVRSILAAEPALGQLLDGLQAIDTAGSPLVTPLGRAYDAIVGARRSAHDAMLKNQPTLLLMLGPTPQGGYCGPKWADAVLLLKPGCSLDGDGLINEQAKASQMPLTVLRAWAENKAAPQVIARQAGTVAQLGIRAGTTRVLELADVRAGLEKALRNLVPLTRQVSFAQKVVIPDEPTGGAVKIKPIGGEGAMQLKSTTSSSVDLSRSPALTVGSKFEGTISALELTLAKVLVISFGEIRYTGGSGLPGHLVASVTDVKFQGDLTFLETLQKWLSPSGAGPYVRLTPDDPGIEAGYNLSLGAIMVGSLTFSNINFMAGARLPFNGGSARFSFSLGTLDQPFLVSALPAPYGGGGFFGLEIGAGGVEASHASFEFGGVVSVAFGPLQGFGRVTTGVYVHQAKPNISITGLFFAGFSGHIACFNVVVSFTLRLAYEQGKMEGKVTLVITISLGIRDLKFHAEAKRSVQGGFKGESQQASLPGFGRVQLASNAPDLGQPRVSGAITTTALDAGADWAAHEAYFDHGLRPGPLP